LTFIQRFFEVPDRSNARAEIVRQALDALNASEHRWTARTVRLWFNNNRRHYVEEQPEIHTPTFGIPFTPPYPQPVPFAYAYVPLHVERLPIQIYEIPAIPVMPISTPPPAAPPPESPRPTENASERPPPPSRALFPMIETSDWPPK
jgi:hypothetical protein